MTRLAKRQKNERIGRIAEGLSILYMFFKGYRLLKQRYKCPAGEIDLIFMHRKMIVFCEVKFRRHADQLLYSVTERQKTRIRRAAEFWMAQEKLIDFNIRFDFIGLTNWQKPVHIKNAF